MRASEGVERARAQVHSALIAVYELREPHDDSESDTERARESDEDKLRGRGRIVCARCRLELSSPMYITPIKPHPARRVVANPAGVLFELITVTDAWGLVLMGPASTEFSWFEDTRWTVACCSGCGAHVGWSFAGLSPESAVSFFGLIAGAIAEH